MQCALLVLEEKKHAAGDVPDEHFSRKPGPAGTFRDICILCILLQARQSLLQWPSYRDVFGVPSIIRAHESRACRDS